MSLAAQKLVGGERRKLRVQSDSLCALGKVDEWEGNVGNDELLLTPRGATGDFFPSSAGADRA